MPSDFDYDYVARTIALMKREEVQKEIQQFKGRFNLDFSQDYLERLSEDRLRHILLAAKIQHKRKH